MGWLKGLACFSLVLIFGIFSKGMAGEQDPSVQSMGQQELAAIEHRLTLSPRLGDLMAYARVKNSALKAAWHSWKAFVEARRLGTAYPDPKLTTTIFPRPMETRLGPQDWNVRFSQPIPFPGLLARRGRVLDANVNLARLQHDQTLKQIFTRIRTHFYELQYLGRALDLAEQNLELNRQMARVLGDAYGRDQSLFYDVSRVEIRRARLENRIRLLKEEWKSRKIRLNALVNRDADAPLGRIAHGESKGPIPSLALDLNGIIEMGFAQGQEIAMAGERIKRAQARLDLAKYEDKPSFSLGLFYAGIGEPETQAQPADAGKDALGVQFGVSLPLWGGKGSSRRAQALAQQNQARALLDARLNQARSRITQIWYRMENARRNFNLHKEQILPRSRQALETAEILFRQGKGQLPELLELQTAVHDFQLAAARFQADYLNGLAELEEWAGALFPRAPRSEK